MRQLARYAFGLTYFLQILILTILMIFLNFLVFFLELEIDCKLSLISFIISLYVLYLYYLFRYLKIRINYELNKLIKLSNVKGNEIVLNLGAGTGQESIFFAKSIKNGKIYGLDKYLYSDVKFLTKLRSIIYNSYIGNTLENAKKNIVIEGVENRCKFIIGDFTKKLDFPDGFFDIIISRQSLYLMPYKKSIKVFEEVDRCLKKGGKVIFYETLKYKNWSMIEAEKFFKEKGYNTEILKPMKKWKYFFYANKPNK